METNADNILATEQRNGIKFFTYIIPKFARAYKMDKQEAYHYLKKIWRARFYV